MLEALGGRENIVSTTQKGSRISVVVDNKKSVDRDQVKECGIDTIVISNKKEAIGLAGVMGGITTEVENSTKNIVYVLKEIIYLK